jgi:uncharacterized protein DUF6600
MKNQRIATDRMLRFAACAGVVAGLYLQSGCTVYVQQPGDASNQPAPVQAPADAPESYSYPNPSTPVASDQGQAPPADDQYQPPPQDVQVVYADDLSPYGSWVNVQGYGQCWQPANRPVGWQPYTVGHWEYCDYGWIWVAEQDEAQWGHLCYHYGRWNLDPAYGWVWVPGVVWAPAWVAWRDGGGYCGWAPLPPEAGFGTRIAVGNVDRFVPANRYVFCREGDVQQPGIYQHIVRNNVTIVNQTTNITNITVVNNVVVNRGVSITNIQRATGRDVQKVELAQASTPEQARQLAGAGKPVVFAPPVVKQAEQQRLQRAQAHPGKGGGVPQAPSPQPIVVHAPNNPAPPAHVNPPAPPGNPAPGPKDEKKEDQHSQPAGGDQGKPGQPAPAAPSGSHDEKDQKQQATEDKQKQDEQQKQQQQQQKQQQEQAQKEQQQRAKDQQDAQEKQKQEDQRKRDEQQQQAQQKQQDQKQKEQQQHQDQEKQKQQEQQQKQQQDQDRQKQEQQQQEQQRQAQEKQRQQQEQQQKQQQEQQQKQQQDQQQQQQQQKQK